MVSQVVRRAFVAITLIVTLVWCARTPAAAEAIPGPLGQLQSALNLMSIRAPGHIGLIVKDLTTGLSTGINESANMPAASTIKIPVMVEVFRQMAAGDFDLSREVTLQRSDRDDGWGDLVYSTLGTRYSVDNLLRLMIADSDNTATNMLIRLVGRAHINQTMERLGLRQTRLADYIRSDGDIRSIRTSPLDMTVLLDAMAHDRLVDSWSSRAMVSILTGQHHNGLLPEPLPAGTAIAHKTGTLHDTLNDVGIVYMNNAPYIIAVLTTHLPTLDSGRRFIRGVSRLAYDSLAKFALWREANPLPGLAAGEPPVTGSPDVKMLTPATVDTDEGPQAAQAQPGTVPPAQIAPAAGTPAPGEVTPAPSPAPETP